MTEDSPYLLTREEVTKREDARRWLRERAQELREAGDLEQAERVQAMADGSAEFERFQLTGIFGRTQ